MKKRVFLLLTIIVSIVFQANAVLKEKDLNSTLVILRKELIDKHDELESRKKYMARTVTTLTPARARPITRR